MTQTRIPTVLFVCLSNAGRSVMAQGLMHHTARKRINATSASTRAKTAVNELSAQVLAELGINILDHQPTQLTATLIDDADLIVIVGTQAHFDQPAANTAIEPGTPTNHRALTPRVGHAHPGIILGEARCSMPMAKKTYPDEFKRDAVALYREH